MLNKNNAFSFKVTNVNHLGLGTNFHLYCSKERNHQKMMIFKNGTTKDDLQYKDLCKEKHHVRNAYNMREMFLKLKTLWLNILFVCPSLKIGDRYHIIINYAILKSFFSKFNPHG